MQEYPRPLRRRERELLEWVLPPERPGYRALRERLSGMQVLGEGRCGLGHLILGLPGDLAENPPVPRAVLAYGMVDTTEDHFSVSVRQEAGGQIEVEIVSGRGLELPDHFEEKRRWTYSEWSPGLPSPSSGRPVREIVVGEGIVLALAVDDRRVWVYDARSGVVCPIPVTNLYNELMLVRKVRDPAIALRSDLLFVDAGSFSDADLRAAFLAYNILLPKVRIPPEPPTVRREGVLVRLRRRFGSRG